MKKSVYLVLLVLPLILFSCETVKDVDNTTGTLHLKTIAGGCNGETFDGLKNAGQEYPDTVIISLAGNDTISIYAGINYICCAPFITETQVLTDTLLMIISDTCEFPYESCYCRCNCYYTWEFFFSKADDKELFYRIELYDPREDGVIVFGEGKVGGGVVMR